MLVRLHSQATTTPKIRVSVLIKRFFGSRAISFDQRIRRFDELSHDGNDGDLGGFSGSTQAFIFSLEIRIVSHCDQRWHV